ncbi:DUF3466 family protein [Methyloversatilis sp.]|uniref:DUF3466 family protein n=1 Tax=Methyloversatilis sp. TaxID=2569862 RepID=UPI002732552B|nr:DUF3466 family protein [Methyloversatilis sp.]MDP2867593.1 DUF3466 family protein [Methyloversatilis sp.]MDP3455986.1 DUF3466 family protein [Methyloversatilis sp.]MDP3579800.1 DUF3466 family protein [Methyloversatilis sp.]
MSTRICLIASALLASGFTPSATDAAPLSYTFTRLGTLGGTYSYARDINDAGVVVGLASKPFSGNSSVYSAFIWNDSTMTELGTLGGTQSLASSINNSGQVVGWANVPGDLTNHAVIWNGGVVTDLNPAGSYGSAANSINDAGQIVGYQDSGATIWNDGVPSRLGGIGNISDGVSSEAYDINQSGQIVGRESDGSGYQVTFWDGSEIAILSKSGYASSLNNLGQVVGVSFGVTAGGRVGNPATIWTGSETIYLGFLGGDHSEGFDINDHGQVVGYGWTPGNFVQHAFIWDDGVMTDLNDVVDDSIKEQGWVLNRALAINNNGWIVGDASNSLTGEIHAFLLAANPVPEPKTYAMVLIGLGLIGAVARRSEQARLSV